jgi:hypothetical protein
MGPVIQAGVWVVEILTSVILSDWPYGLLVSRGSVMCVTIPTIWVRETGSAALSLWNCGNGTKNWSSGPSSLLPRFVGHYGNVWSDQDIRMIYANSPFAGCQGKCMQLRTENRARSLFGSKKKITTFLQLVRRSRKRGSVHPRPHMSSWRSV